MNNTISLSPCWAPSPDPLDLPPNTIDVWRGIVDLPEVRLQAFQQTLSPNEQDRAKRFIFPKHRNRFIAARGMLRVILGRYLSHSPEHISFMTGRNGKPYLSPDVHPESFFFNLSHSQGLALFAISNEREVGIDLEWNRSGLNVQSLAPRVMTDQEIPIFSSIPDQWQKQAFFACWTRKEAYLKARGDGLTCPLKHIRVAFCPNESPALIDVHGHPNESQQWILQELFPRVEYTGALAAPTPPWHTRYWEYIEN